MSRFLFCIAMVLPLLSAPVLAAEERGAADTTGFTFDLGGTWGFDADLDEAGEVSVARAFTGLGSDVPVGEKWRWRSGALYTFSDYDFDAAAAFGGTEPWEQVHVVRLATALSYALNSSWSVYAGPLFTYAAEEGASFSSSVTGGGILGARYSPNERLTLNLGISASSDLDDDPSIFPIIAIKWQLSEDWTLRTASLDAGSTGGAGIDLTRKISPQWSIGAGAAYLSSRFRLDDEGFAPDGVGEDTRVAAFVRFVYAPKKNLEIALLAGANVGGEIRIEDDDGHRLFEEDYDPMPFLGANLVWRF